MTPDIETLIERLKRVESALRHNEWQSRMMFAADVRDAITALRAVQWRPISEAPDGKHLVTDGRRVTIARSDHAYTTSTTRQTHREWVDCTEGEWREVIRATHFMPLPAARASKEG